MLSDLEYSLNIPLERLFIVMSSTWNYSVLNCQTKESKFTVTVKGELNTEKCTFTSSARRHKLSYIDLRIEDRAERGKGTELHWKGGTPQREREREREVYLDDIVDIKIHSDNTT